jgi:hypothetical protein
MGGSGFWAKSAALKRAAAVATKIASLPSEQGAFIRILSAELDHRVDSPVVHAKGIFYLLPLAESRPAWGADSVEVSIVS